MLRNSHNASALSYLFYLKEHILGSSNRKKTSIECCCVLGPRNKTVAMDIEFRLLGQIKDAKQLKKSHKSHYNVVNVTEEKKYSGVGYIMETSYDITLVACG